MVPEIDARVRPAVGLQIKQVRTERRWSQAKLADMLNRATGFRFATTAKYVSKWERGERTPGYEWGPVIERVLGLDLAAIETAARADLTPAPGGAGPEAAGPEAAMPAAEVTDRAEVGTLTGADPARSRVAPPPDGPSMVERSAAAEIEWAGHAPPVEMGADWGPSLLGPGQLGEGEDMRRRALLLGTVGGALTGGVGGVLAGSEPVRHGLDAALGLPTTTADLADWERTTAEYATLMTVSQARAELLPHLLADLAEVQTRIAAAGEGVRPALAGVGAELSGCVAVVLTTCGHWGEAARYWRTARRSARASGQRELSCRIGGRQAIFSLYGPGGPRSAVSLAEEVLTLAEDTPSAGAGHAWAARAQALALAGDRAGAHTALTELTRLHDRLHDTVPAAAATTVWGWSERLLHNAASFVHTYTGNLRAASTAQDAALALEPSRRSLGAAQIRCHQAAGMIVSGDAVLGARHLGEVYQSLAPTHRNGHLRQSISFALDQLPDHAARLPAVREVRELISPSAPTA